MKKLILSVFIFTFGFATETHAQQVNTLLTKQLPEVPGKEIEVITVDYAPEAVDAVHRHDAQLSTFSTGKLRCKFVEARSAGLAPGRYFTNHLKTFIP
jgi:quercetin dioxygenase-like cupin family protein